MKKTVILLTLVLAVSGAFAQKGKVTSAMNFKDTGKLDKALEAIKQAVDPSNPKAEKSLPWPKAWEVRGEIYQAIGVSTDEAVKKLAEDPLTVALESYKKALELDTKNRFGKSLKIKLTLLTNDLSNAAVEAFKEQDYEKALSFFEQVLEVQNIDVVKADNPEAVDTVILFNSGLAAFKAKNYTKAVKYYREVEKYGYNGARIFNSISESYLMMEDTANAIKAVQEGFEKYPEDKNVLGSMIDLYIKTGKNDDALKYLDLAIKQEPKNVIYYFAKGKVLEDTGQEDKAIAVYKKAIEVDETYINAYYNLGALYFNKGVKQYEIASAVPASDIKTYEEEVKKTDAWFDKSIPYMEKCHELNPKETMALETLKNLYYRKKDMDKYNAILKELGEQ